MKVNKICIIIHLYYTDLWDEIISYLNNIEYEYDLHISLTIDNKEENSIFLNRIKNLNNVYIYKLDNRGLDIGPFLYVFNEITQKNLNYDLLLKIHTKKGLHGKRNPNTGEKWRNQLINPILKDKNIVDNIIEKFENDDNIGLIGSNHWLIDKKHPGFYYNLDYVKQYIKLFNLKTNLNDFKFIGGTIFWSRFDIYKKFFIKSNIIRLYGDLETGAFTDSFSSKKTHALERILSMVIMEDGKKIIGI